MYKLSRPVTHSKCKIEDAMIYKGFTVSLKMSHVMWFSNRSDTNQAVQAQKMARG